MELDSLSIPPPADDPLSAPPLANDNSQTAPMEVDPQSAPIAAAATAAAADDGLPPPARKRRRRRKLYPEMIPSHVIRPLRAVRSSTAVYSEALLDELLHLPDDLPSPSRPRPRRRGSAASTASSANLSELDVESLVALSVGFPCDSLSEEEIQHGVISSVGDPSQQSNYIIVRNHILQRWRSHPFRPLTPSHALESIRSAHCPLVASAFSFLLDNAFINFGLTPSLRPPPSPSNPRATVAIVGAGISGLAAARHLLSLGFKVSLLEARSRPGGRVLSRRMVSPTDPSIVATVDLGGSVLTGINGNPLGVLARQLGLPLHKVRDKCPLYLPNGSPVDPEMDAKVEVAFNRLLDEVCRLRESILEEFNAVDAPLGAALEAFRAAHSVAEKPEERMLLNWHLANLEYANATRLSDLSMAFWDQDDPYEMGGDHCFIPGGNGRFVRALAEDLTIFYDHRVSRIQYGSDGVLVYANGKAFRADMVLCTVSLGVLKKGCIEFVPELPSQKQEAIQRLGFGLLNKVAMLFPHDFWGGGSLDTFGHLTEDSDRRGQFFLFYSYTSVSGGPLLVALVAGESAIKFETTPPAEAVERVLGVLRGIFGPKGIEVPDPLQVVCTRWGSDEFTYGSYSYVAVGSSGDDYDVLAESVGDRLFFAGEATNRRYPATMHGALLSGLREAANISRVAKKRAMILPPVERAAAREEVLDLDDLFKSPDISFGNFSVLYDPSSSSPDSTSVVRVGIGVRKLGSGSLFLYGLISRKHVTELGEIDGDEKRLGVLYRNFGTRLVGRNGLGGAGESLIARIKAGRKADFNGGVANETIHD